MSVAFTVARLNTTVTGDTISAAANGSTVAIGSSAHGVIVNEAMAILHCLSVSAAGSFPVLIQGSVDGGTTWTTQGTFGTVSATGIKTLRLTNLAPLIRWKSSAGSGTNVVVVIDVVGVFPIDSYLTNDTAIVAA